MENKPNTNPSTTGVFPAETPVGMAYVPFQVWEKTYPENEAFEKGTIFPSLFLPFVGRQVSNK